MPNKSWYGFLLGILFFVLGDITTCSPPPNLDNNINTPFPAPTLDTGNGERSTQAVDQLVAFPGAEGFGSRSAGGRGGQVIEVTNLNDAGTGSLREAIDREGARIIVFRVSGTIELLTDLVIANPYVTIAGQTAPGGGITIRGIDSHIDALLNVHTHDVVIRYLTLRAGPPSTSDNIQIIATDAHDTYNVVIDHNSMSWAVNRNLTTWYDSHDISIQWNIFSEGLDCSVHPKGCHSKGVLLGGYASDEEKDKPGASNISFHHNLMAHNAERNPLISTSGVTDVVNNVAYNSRNSFSQVDFQSQLSVIPVNYVGNFYKNGPDTDPNKYGVNVASQATLGAKIFMQGNIGPHRVNEKLPESNIADLDARPFVVTVRNPAAEVTTTSAPVAYEQVLAWAGANVRLGCDGTLVPRRDAIDTRIVNEVKSRKGKIIDDPSQVGGWLTIEPAAPCSDNDHDGMADVWESSNNLDPNDSSDAAQDIDQDGYTNIEEFLNGSDPLH